MGDDALFKPSTVKIRPGVRPGRESEKKVAYNQDRTGQYNKRSYKSVIFYIFGGKLPVKLLQ